MNEREDTPGPPEVARWHEVLRLLVGLALSIPAALFVVAGFVAGLGLSSWVYLLALVGLCTGLVGSRSPRREIRLLVPASLGMFLLTMVVRCGAVGGGDGALRAVSLPSGGSISAVGAVVSEEDTVRLGAQLMQWFGVGASDDELAGLGAALALAYDEMRADVGNVRSPFFGTLLGAGGGDGAFDALVLDPAPPPEAGDVRPGIVFLHGFAGNWSILCWLVARAAADSGAVTICPSADFAARWHRYAPRVRASMAELRRRGATHIYLAGLSQGAVGAGRLAPALATELSGLVLLFGYSRTPPPSTLPTLLVTGDRDTRFPGRFLADRWKLPNRSDVAWTTVSGDHFALVKQRPAVARVVREWVAARAARK